MADYGALGNAISIASGQGQTRSGDLGYEIDGVFRVVDPDDPKRFIVRFPNGNWVSALHRNKVQQKPGLPVIVGTDNIGRPYIVDVDPTRIDNFLSESSGGATVGIHDHVRNSPLQYVVDTWLLKQLRMYVVSGTVVAIVAGSYFWAGALHWYEGGTIDLSAYLPPSTGHQWWLIVGLDPVTETIVVRHGNSSYGNYPLDPKDIELVPFIELGYMPVAAMWVNNGATLLQNFQIEDLRYASGWMAGYLTDLSDVMSDYDYNGYVLEYTDGYWSAKPKIRVENADLDTYPAPGEVNAAFGTQASGYPVLNDDNGTGDRYRLFVKKDNTWVMFQGQAVVGTPVITSPAADGSFTTDTMPTFTWTAA